MPPRRAQGRSLASTTRRQRPYTKKPRLAVPQTSHPFPPFLRLPLELRVKVYDCFDLPALLYEDVLRVEKIKSLPYLTNDNSNEEEENDLESNAIKTTRKALTLVCRQINIEWKPFFFKKVNVAARHPSLLKRAANKSYQHGTGKDYCNAFDFANLFLRKLPENRLRGIRHLIYIDRHTTPSERYSGLSFHVPRPGTDIAGLKKLATVLKVYGDSLESLQQVTLSALRNRVMHMYWRSWFLDGRIAHQLNNCREEQWKEFTNVFSGKDVKGILNNKEWEALTHIFVRQEFKTVGEIYEVELDSVVFRKRARPLNHGLEQLPTPKVVPYVQADLMTLPVGRIILNTMK